MIILPNSNTVLQVITLNTNTLQFIAEWDDLSNTSLNRGTSVGTINTATTTAFVGSPSSGTERSVKQFSIKNTGNTTSTITVQKNNGSVSYDLLATITLAVQETLTYVESVGYVILDAYGVAKTNITVNTGGSANTINAAYSTANSAYSVANLAYGAANTAAGEPIGTAAYSAANLSNTVAQTAVTLAGAANTNALNAYSVANLAYQTANAAPIDIFANSGLIQANSPNLTFNNTATINASVIANGSFGANIAFTVNTAAIGGGGNYQADVLANGTMALSNANLNFNNTSTVNVAVQANGTTQANISFSVNTSALGSASAAYNQANLAYSAANSAQTSANVANVTGQTGITLAVAGNTYAQTLATLITTANTQGNNAYLAANSAQTYSNTLSTTVNTTFATLNTSLGSMNTAFGNPVNTAVAAINSAMGTVNTTFGTVNSTFGTVNSTFASLNTSITSAANVRLFVGGVLQGNSQNINIVSGNTSNLSIVATVNSIPGNTTITFDTLNPPGTGGGGNGSPGGANTQIQYNNGGAFGGSPNLSFNVATNTFVVGTQVNYGTWVAQFNVNANNFSQVGVCNPSNGTNASADFVITGDTGNDSFQYLDIGWNNSQWNDPTFTIAGANSGYIYSQNGAFAFGTSTPLNDAVMFVGGTLSSNEAMRAYGANGNIKINNSLTVLSGFQLGQPFTTGSVYWSNNAGQSFFGIYDSGNSLYYGISKQLPSPTGTATIGGYYKGLGIGGSTNQTSQPIFGVLTSSQAGSGKGNVAFTIVDTNLVQTYNNTLDDGSGNMVLAGSVNASTFITSTGLNLVTQANNAYAKANSAAAPSLVIQNSSYTEASTSGIKTVLANATSGNVVVTLPSAASSTAFFYTVKKVDSSINIITITAAGADTIDGGSTALITTRYAAVTITSDGINWNVI